MEQSASPPSQEIEHTPNTPHTPPQILQQNKSEIETDKFHDKTRRRMRDNSCVFLNGQIYKLNKQNVSVAVPTSHKLLHSSHLAKQQSKAEKYDKLMKELSHKEYCRSATGDTMLDLGRHSFQLQYTQDLRASFHL